jgi:cryptochrome
MEGTESHCSAYQIPYAYQGGETEALARLAASLSDKTWVAAFEKPKGDPSAFIKPATTVLSPHLKFGCLSPRLFYESLQRVSARTVKATHSILLI